MTEVPHIEDEQRRIAELLHSFDVPAPEPLHRRIESLVASHPESVRAALSWSGRASVPSLWSRQRWGGGSRRRGGCGGDMAA